MRFQILTLFPDFFPSPLASSLIGKEGRTAKALRAVLNAAAARKNQRIALEIIEKDTPKPE